jgi:ubiquinol-cytochrome c reductase cytochrome c subunit
MRALAVALLVLLAPASAAAAATSGQRGREAFQAGCASCHGAQAAGVPGRGPSLRGVGLAAVDFYLRTGRMPLADPGVQPVRARPRYDGAQVRDIEAYVASLGRPPGPPIPRVDPARGDLKLGRRLFADSCSGCHQTFARGGIAPGLVAPPLTEATATQIGEAIRVGPYLMPQFSPRQLDVHDVDSIARYVLSTRRHPVDAGGWAIGNLGPIPEGLIVWFVGAVALVIVARIIGERAT